MSHPTIPELTRIVSFDKVSATNQIVYDVVATETERKDLAKRFGIVSVDLLKATFTLSQSTDPGCYFVDGMLQAHVTQSCVVTLEDVPESMQTPIHIVMRPGHQKMTFEEEAIDHTEERDIDFVQADGTIDLGEISSQYLILSLNPYPRSGAVMDNLKLSSGEDPEPPKSPFAVLKKLKK